MPAPRASRYEPERQGRGLERTHLVEGYFEHSLNDELKARLRPRRIAIALIDCDLYESTVLVLNFIEDLIVEGTILLFDDWNCFHADGERGQRKAFADFLERNGQLSAQAMFSYGRYGQCSRCGPIAHVQGGGAQLNAPSTGQASWLVSRNYPLCSARENFHFLRLQRCAMTKPLLGW